MEGVDTIGTWWGYCLVLMPLAYAIVRTAVHIHHFRKHASSRA